MNRLTADLRSAIRSFRRRRTFVAVTVALLSLALAATNIMFTLIDAVLLRPLPFADPQRLAWLTSIRPDRDDGPFNVPDYRDLRDRNRTTEEIAAIAHWSAILSGSGPAERLQGVRVSSNLFHLLGVSADAGRLLVPADDAQPDPRVVVISHSLWRVRFGADRTLSGRTIMLDGQAYVVAGVLPPAFQLPVYSDAAVIAPLAPDFHPWKSDRDSVNFLCLVGRLKPGVTREQAQADLTAVAHQIAHQFPESNGRKLGVKVTALQRKYTGAVSNSLLLLLAAVLLVLLIACANLANLILTQIAARETELAIRTALGATRTRIVRQLTLENLTIALTGGSLGYLLTRSAVPALLRFLPTQMPRAREITAASHVLVFSMAMATFSALLFGLLPALQSRLTSAGLVGSSRGSTSGMQATHLRDAIGAAEIAICVVLMIGTALLFKSFVRLQSVNLGFEPAKVLTARISLPTARYRSTADLVKFYESFRTRLSVLPGIESAGVVSDLPLSEVAATVPFSLDGHIASHGHVPEAQFRVATPDYFRASGIAFEKGRGFSEQDSRDSEPVAIVNRTLASHFWPSGKALGAPLTFYDGDATERTARIVGIVDDVKQTGLDAAPTFDIYMPLRQLDDDAVTWLTDSQFWVVRSAVAVGGLREALRQALNSTDSGAGASDVQPLEWYVASALAVRRFNLTLIAAFGVTALLLATTGLYAVLSYSVAIRRREIGTRIALGASPRQILQMVLWHAARMILIGLVAGVVVGRAVSYLIRSLLFGVYANDAAAFVTVPLLVAAVALLSGVVPAWRASRTDPLAALRAG